MASASTSSDATPFPPTRSSGYATAQPEVTMTLNEANQSLNTPPLAALQPPPRVPTPAPVDVGSGVLPEHALGSTTVSAPQQRESSIPRQEPSPTSTAEQRRMAARATRLLPEPVLVPNMSDVDDALFCRSPTAGIDDDNQGASSRSNHAPPSRGGGGGGAPPPTLLSFVPTLGPQAPVATSTTTATRNEASLSSRMQHRDDEVANEPRRSKRVHTTWQDDDDEDGVAGGQVQRKNEEDGAEDEAVRFTTAATKQVFNTITRLHSTSGFRAARSSQPQSFHVASVSVDSANVSPSSFYFQRKDLPSTPQPLHGRVLDGSSHSSTGQAAGGGLGGSGAATGGLMGASGTTTHSASSLLAQPQQQQSAHPPLRVSMSYDDDDVDRRAGAAAADGGSRYSVLAGRTSQPESPNYPDTRASGEGRPNVALLAQVGSASWLSASQLQQQPSTPGPSTSVFPLSPPVATPTGRTAARLRLLVRGASVATSLGSDPQEASRLTSAASLIDDANRSSLLAGHPPPSFHQHPSGAPPLSMTPEHSPRPSLHGSPSVVEMVESPKNLFDNAAVVSFHEAIVCEFNDGPLPTAEHQPETTSNLFETIGNYMLLEKIGSGQQGTVRRGARSDNGAPVAVKIIPRATESAIKKQQQMRELSVSLGLSHDHIVKCYEIIRPHDANMLYLIMQYAEGGSAATVGPNSTCTTKPLMDLRRLARQAGDALQYLHRMKVTHRDIKPDNLLLDEVGNLLLADFGVCSVRNSPGDDLSVSAASPPTTGHITGPSDGQGAIAFRAPEEFHNVEEIADTTTVDMWSLGVTLYGMTFGVLPFTGAVFGELRKAILEKEPDFSATTVEHRLARFPNETRQELTWWIDQALRPLLDKSPHTRLRARQLKGLLQGASV